MDDRVLNEMPGGEDRRIGNEIPRRREDRELDSTLQQHLCLEQLVTRLSAIFINLPCNQFDTTVENALREISEFLKSDFTTLIVIDPDTGDLQHGYQWVGPRIKVEIDFINFDINRQSPWVAQSLRKGKPFTLDLASDWPREAVEEKVIMEQLGIELVHWVPFQMEGRVVGCIAINRMDRELIWPAEFLPSIRLLGEILANALARKHANESLRNQHQFESVMLRLTAELVNISGEGLDQKIDELLSKVCEFASCDEALLMKFKNEAADTSLGYSWFRDNKVRDWGFDMSRFLEEFPIPAEIFKRGQIICFGSLDEFLPEAVNERAYLESMSINAACAIPWMDGDLVGGMLIVQNLTERSWPLLFTFRRAPIWTRRPDGANFLRRVTAARRGPKTGQCDARDRTSQGSTRDGKHNIAKGSRRAFAAWGNRR